MARVCGLASMRRQAFRNVQNLTGVVQQTMEEYDHAIKNLTWAIEDVLDGDGKDELHGTASAAPPPSVRQCAVPGDHELMTGAPNTP